MCRPVAGPLDELDDAELYNLLGDAWLEQVRPVPGQVNSIQSSAEIGQREFEALMPMLQHDLARSSRNSVVACVAGTIRRAGAWRMPAYVVAALVARKGILPSSNFSAA